MGEGGPNERWGVRKPPLRTCVDVKASPGTPYATHTLHRGTLSECLFFFSIYSLLTRQLWCFQRHFVEANGPISSKTKVLSTWNPVHRLMLSTHHLVRTHVPPGGLSPPLSLPWGPVPPSLSSSTLAGCSIPRSNGPTENAQSSSGHLKNCPKKIVSRTTHCTLW